MKFTFSCQTDESSRNDWQQRTKQTNSTALPMSTSDISPPTFDRTALKKQNMMFTNALCRYALLFIFHEKLYRNYNNVCHSTLYTMTLKETNRNGIR